ncbi:MAG: HD-GYP domain-containing protein [Calditrichia bacterium]
MMNDKQIHQIKEENKRLKSILHVAQSLQSELDIKRLLGKIMSEVKKILQADRCTVFLVDDETNELWSFVAMGLKGGEIRFPKDKGIAGHVAVTGEILNIPDAYKDERFNPDIDKKTGYRTKSMLTMPMRNQAGEIIGVFQVLNKHDGPFTTEDEEVLDAISHIAATAVENALLYEEQVLALNSFIEMLSQILDKRDYITSGHSWRVTQYAIEIAKKMQFDFDQLEKMRIAGLLHDIGKIGIPEAVLFKDGPLDDEEYKLIKSHAYLTKEILESIRFQKKYRDIPQIAASHHEKLNGNGYPDKLKMEEIPLGGRILAVADVFDALTSKRQYRDRDPLEKVLNLIERELHETFDEQVFKAFLSIDLSTMFHIMEHQNNHLFNDKELAKLKEWTIGDFYSLISSATEVDETYEEIMDVFLKYYWQKY